MTNTEAFALAQRKSKATHRNWLVWDSSGVNTASNEWETAEISPASIDRACAAVGPAGKFTLVQHRRPYFWTARQGIAEAWKANLEAGYYTH